MKVKGICKDCGQEIIIHARGLCRNCYAHHVNNGTIENYPTNKKSKLKKCKVEGCEEYSRANGYCVRHYNQVRKNGNIIGNVKRNKLDKNEIIICDDYAKLILYDTNSFPKEEYGMIDIEDIDKIKDIKWTLCNGYIHNNKIGGLHRLIMYCKNDNLVVDHINHNGLDNRKCNLRICTPQENNINISIPTTNTTGIIGLFYDNKYDKWTPNIGLNGQVLFLGRYDNKEDAIKERLKAEVVYFGEYAPQKHLFKEYGIDENIKYNVKSIEDMKPPGNNKGVKGIFKGSGMYKDKWKIEFVLNGKKIYLGYHDTLDKAITVKENYINNNSI